MGTLGSHEAFALAVNVRACLAKIGVFVGPDGLAVEADYCEVQLDPADIDLTVLFGEANYDTAGDTPIEILPDVFGPGWTATVNQIYADETETAETVWIRIFPPVKMEMPTLFTGSLTATPSGLCSQQRIGRALRPTDYLVNKMGTRKATKKDDAYLGRIIDRVKEAWAAREVSA
jgi:hypothetical protein